MRFTIEEPGTYELTKVVDTPPQPQPVELPSAAPIPQPPRRQSTLTRPTKPIRPNIIDLPTLRADGDLFRLGVYGSTTYDGSEFKSFLVGNRLVGGKLTWEMYTATSSDGLSWGGLRKLEDDIQCCSVQRRDQAYVGYFCRGHKYQRGVASIGSPFQFQPYANGNDIISHYDDLVVHKSTAWESGQDRTWFANKKNTTGLNQITADGDLHEIETYQLGLWSHNNQWVGFRTTFFVEEERESGWEGGAMFPVLALSSDGANWTMPYGYQPLIKETSGMIACQSQPVIVGDELWMYFFETSYGHNGYKQAAGKGTATHGMKLAIWKLVDFESMLLPEQQGAVDQDDVRDDAAPSLNITEDWGLFNEFDSSLPQGSDLRAEYLKTGRSLAGDPKDYWHAVALWKRDGKPTAKKKVDPKPKPAPKSNKSKLLWLVDAGTVGAEYNGWARSLNAVRRTKPAPGWNAWDKYCDKFRCIAKHMAPILSSNGSLRFEVRQDDPDHHCHVAPPGATRLEFGRTYELSMRLQFPEIAQAWALNTPWSVLAQFWGSAALNPPVALMIKRGYYAVQHYAATDRVPSSNAEWSETRDDHSRNNLRAVDDKPHDIAITHRPSLSDGYTRVEIDGEPIYEQAGPNAIVGCPPLVTVGLYTPSTSVSPSVRAVVDIETISLWEL